MNLAKFLNQKAVYWANPINDGFGGITYDSPVEVSVRWTVKQERFLASEGSPLVDNVLEELLSRVVVLAESDFELKGKMKLGLLIDLDSDQLPDNDSMTIMGFEKIPTIKADQFLRKVYLV